MGNTIENNVIDIDLSALKKKRIRINGDDTKIVELNVSDMGVITRLQEAYDKLLSLANEYNLQDEAAKAEEGDDSFDADKAIETLKVMDAEMRERIDFIFLANVSSVCADDGTMADPLNGQFRFEHIIEKFLDVYDKNFTDEFKKMSKNVKKHTNKYARRN